MAATGKERRVRGGGFAGLMLPASERADLARKVSGILPFDGERQARFLDQAEEAASYYFNASRPAWDGLPAVKQKLDDLARAARKFAAAVAALDVDEDGTDRLAISQKYAGSLEDIPDYQRTRDAAAWATLTATAAENLMRNRLFSPGRPGPAVDGALNTLVTDIAWAYGAIFDERASAAREGLFARALTEILAACGICEPGADGTPAIGESRLRGIINDRFLPGRPPARGPKRRRAD